ncbi:MAG: M50 family metallopeptidase [Planctomycetes bacterium]|nr:M50 family metallopeptidase [Planctomycetota bacterium]
MASYRCETCGVVIPALCQVAGDDARCADCRDAAARVEDQKKLRKLLWWLGAFALLVIYGLAAGWSFGIRRQLFDWWLGDFAVVALVSLLLVFPHELAHAVTCRLLGGDVPCIEIGRGPRGWRRRLLGIDWRIRSISPLGFTRINLLTPRRYRLRQWLVIAAGPAVHVVFAAGGLVVMATVDSLVCFWLARDFVLANVFDLALNLWPHRWTTEEGIAESDGLQLVRTPFKSREYVLGELAAAYDLANRQVSPGPDAERARRRMLLLVERGDLPATARVFLRSGIAWSDLLLGDELDDDVMHVDEADRLSEAALTEADRIPVACDDAAGAEDRADWPALPLRRLFPTIEGTRGCVLIARGEIEHGSRLVLDARRRLRDRHLAALYTCFLAHGARKRGRTRSAQAYLTAARRLDRTCPLLTGAEGAAPRQGR